MLVIPPRPLALLILFVLCATASAQRSASPPRLGRTPVDRFRRLPPEERRRAVERLPPDRRQQFERRFNRLEQLPPADRDALDRRYQTFHQLPPERQQAARNAFRRFTELPARRRQEVRNRVRTLRNLPADERTAYLGSDDFQQRYSPGEQQLVRELSETLPD